MSDVRASTLRTESSPPVTLWLASRSPRRHRLLAEAGLEARSHRSDLDDADLRRGAVPAECWVMALAYFKARRVLELIRRERPAELRGEAVVLGADTVCVLDDEIFGQPRDQADARRMMLALRNVAHRTMTGVCLLNSSSGRRWLLLDVATVFIGAIPDDAIETYLASGHWKGKAGGYNLIERQQAGWPIRCEGDPTTVMGLPMRALPGWLERFCRVAS